MKTLKKDQLIKITADEYNVEDYDDYYTVAIVKILETFNYTQVLDAYLTENCIIPTEGGRFNCHLFVEYLRRKGLIELQERMHLPTLHIGSCGCPTIYK